MNDSPNRRTVVAMDTFVTIDIVAAERDPDQADAVSEALERAFGWFEEVERRCSRFDPESELRQLTSRVNVAVPVSALLFGAISFAVAVAEESGGAFDPTVGYQMEARGFNRNYRTGDALRPTPEAAGAVTYRHIHLDTRARTITLLRPLVLDLGAVAKGLAIDLAARELLPFENFMIDAGGDLYVGGRNRHGAPWSVGIRHPRRDRELIAWLRASNKAVCTSGDYERTAPDNPEGGHHILDPREYQNGTSTGGTGRDRRDNAGGQAASVTVVAPSAMLADALGTAAFVLGPSSGLELLERMGADGLIVSTELERYTTRGMRIEYQRDEEAGEPAHGTAEVFPIAQGAVDHRPGSSPRPRLPRTRR